MPQVSGIGTPGIDGAPTAKARSPVGLWVFLAAAGCLGVAAFVMTSIVRERDRAEEGWRVRLSTLADDRKAAVESWLWERENDAKTAAASPAIGRWFAGLTDTSSQAGDLDAAQGGKNLLTGIVRNGDYVGAHLTDREGNVLWTIEGTPRLGGGWQEEVRRILEHNGSGLTNLTRDQFGRVALCAVACIGPNAEWNPWKVNGASGSVVLVASPERTLFPMLQRTTLPATSGQVFLVAKQGDRVRFLSPLRDLGAPEALAAEERDGPPSAFLLAAQRKTHLGECQDYRRVRVLAATRGIAGTGWGLVAKVDSDDAMASFQRHLAWSTAAGFAVLASLIAIVFGALRNQRYRLAQATLEERRRAENRVLRLNRLLRTTSSINELMVRETQPERLLSEACRILVETGGFREASIQARADSEDTWKTVASHASGREGTETIKTERVDAHGGRAILPLRLSANRRGTLVVVPGTDPLDEDGEALLDELAQDLTFALLAAENRTRLVEAEARVLERERSYRLLFERNTAGVYRSALDGRLLDCNEAFSRTFGFASPAEAMAGPLRDLYSDPRARDVFLRRLCEEGILKNHEFEGRTRDGRRLWLIENASLVGGGEGADTVVEGTIIDITEKRRAEESMRLLTQAVRQTTEAVLVTDREGKLLFMNPAFENQSGYSSSEALGKTPNLVKSGAHDEDFYRRMWEVLLGGETWSGEMVNRRKDGTDYIVQASISPVRDSEGRITAFVAVERDLTEWRAIQERLESARTFETLGMLAGRVAHDVRNPLFAIGVNVAALEKTLGEDQTAEAFLSNIRQQSARLSNLMNDLLVLGKPIKPETFMPIALSAVAEHALTLASSEPEDGERPFRLEDATGALTISGAHDQLVQAVYNLLINARYFSPPDGQVLIRIWGDDEHACLSVRDAGPGVPPDQIGQLFEPFFSMRKGGTGLGLTIVRKIVEAHGGTVDAASNAPEAGATFTIRLPLSRF